MNVEKFYKSIPENDYKIEESVFKQFELQEEEYVKDPTIKTIRL